jgi:hypothetical protein
MISQSDCLLVHGAVPTGKCNFFDRFLGSGQPDSLKWILLAQPNVRRSARGATSPIVHDSVNLVETARRADPPAGIEVSSR